MVSGLNVERLLRAMAARADTPAIHWRGHERSYRELSGDVMRWGERLRTHGVGRGQVVALRGDYSPEACAALLALAARGTIVVPLSRSTIESQDALLEIAGVEHVIDIDAEESAELTPTGIAAAPALVVRFRGTGHAGLVVFSSGSTGRPKGILHDFERVVAKFERPRTAYRTLQFLLFDHFGGLNTLLGTLAAGGVVVIAEQRSPSGIAKVVETARVELLPVTPTFLTLLMASGTHRSHDFSSVKVITYGTEAMPDATLARVAKAFPNARLQQTYGLSELGVLRSRSRDSDSPWLQVGGQGFETRIVNGTLHVRSEFAMVGYLNAPAPFDAEGWMNTGDIVDREGDWIRIRGRSSDLINVGGQKVFPAEVEGVLAAADNVIDATVHGEPHPVLGSIVVAEVTLASPEDDDDLRQRLRRYCREHLAPYKIPMKISASVTTTYGARFKKMRPSA